METIHLELPCNITISNKLEFDFVVKSMVENGYKKYGTYWEYMEMLHAINIKKQGDNRIQTLCDAKDIDDKCYSYSQFVNSEFVKSKEMKSYQFVKNLNSYDVGYILTPEVKAIYVSGLEISIEALLQQGFIKEYKEPEYTAGDYIVGSFANYQEVRKIVQCKVEGNSLWWTQEELNGDISDSFHHSWRLSEIRKATPEQIQTWNKTQQEYKERLKIYGYEVVFNQDNTINVGCKKEIHKKYLDSMLLVAEFCNDYEVEMSFNTLKEMFIDDSEKNEYSSIEKIVNKLK